MVKYIVRVDNAQDLKDEIIYRISQQVDQYGRDILTWGIYNTNDDTVIEHTKDQWEDKGCIAIIVNDDNDKLMFKFHYWDSYPKEYRNDIDEKYLLGRLTELYSSFTNPFQWSKPFCGF